MATLFYDVPGIDGMGSMHKIRLNRYDSCPENHKAFFLRSPHKVINRKHRKIE